MRVPLPFVPATWTNSRLLCGLPRREVICAMLERSALPLRKRDIE